MMTTRSSTTAAILASLPESVRNAIMKNNLLPSSSQVESTSSSSTGSPSPKGVMYAPEDKGGMITSNLTQQPDPEGVNDYTQKNFPYKGIEVTEQFKSPLFSHQSETVEWMLYREEMIYENIRGGMLLHSMGVGKTLCALATVVLNKGLTLIVVPAQLVYVWESEINRHFTDIPYFAYHGHNRKQKFESYRLKNGDPLMLLMSYQSVSKDIEDESGPLVNLKFHRIIYDECHYIKNQNTEVFKSLLRVKSTIKWFISGTPIMNRIQEIYPYLKLLNYKHLSRVPQTIGGQRVQAGNRFNRYTRYHQEEVKRQVYVDMQNLLKEIAIRRTKEILDLPNKISTDILVSLNAKERRFYDLLQEYSRSRVRKLMMNMKKVRNSGLTAADQNRLRVIILQCMLSLIFHLRIACCEPLLVIDKISRTKNLDMDSAIAKLQTEDDKDCNICFNNVADVRNKKCGHSACADCWKRLAKLEPMRCFTCMEDTTSDELEQVVEGDQEFEFKRAHDARIFHRSSKTRKVLDIVKDELGKGNKIVIVSQWTTYLDQLIAQFKCENKDVPFIKLDGRTLPIKRQKMVDQFQDDPDIKVCFASLSSSSEGITLHSACSMVICDMFWNKAKIDQISDRIHRIGQKKEVQVYCIYMSETIEMKLKELVEKKDVVCKVLVDCAPITNVTDSWLSRMIKLID